MEWFWTTYLKVKWMMCTFMNSDLSRQFKNLTTMEIVGELKNRFSAQVRIVRFECLNGFLSLKMEENTCLEQQYEDNAWDTSSSSACLEPRDEWRFRDRWGDTLASPQLQELCRRLCHRKGFDHILWVCVSATSCQSGTHRKRSWQCRKYILIYKL